MAEPNKLNKPKNFGRRREFSTITIERNGRQRMYRFSPLGVTVVVSLLAMFFVGYLSATAYLVLRDDLIGLSRTRNVRMAREYEDRIAELRANIDRITSRQLLDQQAIESRLSELMKRQAQLEGQSSKLQDLIGEASRRGLDDEADTRADTQADPGPDERAALPGGPARAGMFDTAALSLRGSLGALFGAKQPPESPLAQSRPDITKVTETEAFLASFGRKMESLDGEQIRVISAIREKAKDRVEAVSKVLARLDISNPEIEGAMGGPFIPLQPDSDFDSRLDALETSLEAMDRLGEEISSLPLSRPLPDRFHSSSSFGTRMDPFLKRIAMHSGTDFSAPSGTPVHASASGVVVEAGRRGGYGNLVEIDHGDGFATRYGHLSRIAVSVGDKVRIGDIVGAVGSTGRSTGPHLHYEVRRSGIAKNPGKYLNAGRELARLLPPAEPE